MKRHAAAIRPSCLAAQGDDADDGTIDSKVDELALLHQ